MSSANDSPRKGKKVVAHAKEKLKKQLGQTYRTIGLPKNGMTLQTSSRPRSQEYDKHRSRFGVQRWDPAEDKFMRNLVSKIARMKGAKSGKSGDIPFNWATIYKGTQAPAIRLYYTHDDVNTTNNTAVADVFPVQGSSFINWADFAGVFNEYRFIGGEMLYFSTVDCNTSTGATAARYLGTGVGVVDYDNAGALTSFNNGLEFDSKQMINLFHTATGVKARPVKFPIWLEPLPDQEWISVTDGGATDVAWLKLYVEANHVVPTANEAGFVTGWMDIQWRNTGSG